MLPVATWGIPRRSLTRSACVPFPLAGGPNRSRLTARSGGRSAGVDRIVLLIAIARLLDLPLRSLAALPVQRFRLLSRLELFVDVEEVIDLQLQELRDFVEAPPLDAHVPTRHREDLCVRPLLISHPQHRDRTAPHVAAGEGGLVGDDEQVERVAVLRERRSKEHTS